VLRKTGRSQESHLEYDYRQFIHRSYVALYHSFLRVLNQLITTIGINWLRKMKWLYTFVINLFVSFDTRGLNLHESVAKEYSKVFLLLLKIVTNYMLTFKSGLFPQNKLNDLAFAEEYSLCKLAEALLYNEYPFDEAEAMQYQNYQKQRKSHEVKNKQYLIDVVNFNMKSLNINLHWDSLLIKLVPSLKNSVRFGKELLQQSLFFLLKYFELTSNFQEAPKLLLMLANAKNTHFTIDREVSSLIKKIKASVYPDCPQVKEGIEFFCEEYFNQHTRHSKRRMEEEELRRKKGDHLELCQGGSLNINNINSHPIKKTESYDSMLEGWENFESVKDSAKDGSELKDGLQRDNMFHSVDSENGDIFYSINESKAEKMKHSIVEEKE
jgi:hypothetical protein